MTELLTKCHVLAVLFALSVAADSYDVDRAALDDVVQLRNTYISNRNSRSISVPFIGSWFGGDDIKEKETLPVLANYPLWRVHKYNGIALKPVSILEATQGLATGSEYPSVPPTLPPEIPGPPPSIVNVPQPIYTPPNSYGIPSTIYDPPAAPYQSTQYASAGAQSIANSGSTSGTDSTETEIGNTSGSEGDTAAALESLSSLGSLIPEGGNAGDLANLAALAGMLPPSVLQKLSSVVSRPGAMEKISAILGIWTNKEKLKKSGNLGSLGKYLQSWIGVGDGAAEGASDIAISSGTYTQVPVVYPGTQGFLSKLPIIGTGVSGIPLPELPALPPLPKIPGTKFIPDGPKLPFINLPATPVVLPKTVGGPYVSVRLPEPAAPYPAPPPSPPQPASTYSAPPAPPPEPANTYYAPPTTTPAPNYYSPQPISTYSAPPPPHPEPANSYYAPPTTTPAPTYYSPQPISMVEPPKYLSESYSQTYQAPPQYAQQQTSQYQTYEAPLPTSYQVPIYPTYSAPYQAPVKEYSPPSTYYSVPTDGYQAAASETRVVFERNNNNEDNNNDSDGNASETDEETEPSGSRSGSGYSRVVLQRGSATLKERIKALQAAKQSRTHSEQSRPRSSKASKRTSQDNNNLTSPSSGEPTETSGVPSGTSEDRKSHKRRSHNTNNGNNS